MSSIAELGGLGQRGLDRFGARLAVLYLLLALIGTPLVANDGRLWWGPTFAVAVICCAVALGIGLDRHAGAGGLLVMLMVAIATAAVSAGIAGATPLERSGEIANWVLTGICGGVAVARGRVWGVATLVSTVGIWVATETTIGSHSPAIFLFGPVVVTFVGIWVHHAAGRGFAGTERSISVMAEVDAAQRVAEHRWDAAQRDSRRLHDTVLNTLTVLSHGGVGLSAREIRDVCERDLQILAGQAQTDPPDQPSSLAAGASRAALADGLNLVDVGERIQGHARRLGVELSVHGVEVLHESALPSAQARTVVEALAECLQNVRRHSGVQTATLIVAATLENLSIVLSDEGCGFDPAQIPADRLGLLGSVREPIAEAGGDVRIWSQPGRGTSVLINLPLTQPTPVAPAAPTTPTQP